MPPGTSRPRYAAAGTQGFIQTFFDEVFNHLDPYSRYAAPAEAATDRIRRDGRASLGMTLGRVGDGFVIQAVERDGPAAQAGIRAGDRLLMIDGEDVQGAELEDVVAALAGQEETAISLTVRRRGGAPRTLPLTRVQLVASTVEVRRSGALTVIRISLFARDTADRLRRAMPRDRRAGTGVVIDLRGNRGGLLRQAVAAAGVLLAPGPVARTEGRDPEAVNDFRASGEDPALGFPVIVLVDGRTASAAEIMAQLWRIVDAPWWWEVRHRERAWCRPSRHCRTAESCSSRGAGCSHPLAGRCRVSA